MSLLKIWRPLLPENILLCLFQWFNAELVKIFLWLQYRILSLPSVWSLFVQLIAKTRKMSASCYTECSTGPSHFSYTEDECQLASETSDFLHAFPPEMNHRSLILHGLFFRLSIVWKLMRTATQTPRTDYGSEIFFLVLLRYCHTITTALC